MDILAHSLWAIAVIPGEQIAGKIILGIMPDLAVFGPNLLVIAIKGKKLPRFKTRENMMDWFEKKDNRWVKTLYRWTHSLVIWSLLIMAGFFLCKYHGYPPPWFLLAAPLHILLDIPTHTKKSFPVEFLTPLSSFQLDGIHWSQKWVLIINYLIVSAILLFRYIL
jgi:hypothetical protein